MFTRKLDKFLLDILQILIYLFTSCTLTNLKKPYLIIEFHNNSVLYCNNADRKLFCQRTSRTRFSWLVDFFLLFVLEKSLSPSVFKKFHIFPTLYEVCIIQKCSQLDLAVQLLEALKSYVGTSGSGSILLCKRHLTFCI